jgi:hypothetical protein
MIFDDLNQSAREPAPAEHARRRRRRRRSSSSGSTSSFREAVKLAEPRQERSDGNAVAWLCVLGLLVVAALGFDLSAIAGIGGAHLDPGDEIGDDGVGEFGFFGGHLEVFFEMLDGADEEAGFWVAGEDGWLATVTAFFPTGFGVEVEVTFEFFGLSAVAGVAMLDERRPDFLLEEGNARRVGGEQGRSEEYPRSNKE